MYSLAWLILELETARRRLLYIFEVTEGTAQMDLERASNSRWAGTHSAS
jgi:hypothetical protein